MSLRFRLNVLTSLLFVLVFLGAGAYVVLNAREAVREEMQSTSQLALQLVDLVLEGAGRRDGADLQEYMVERFSRLESTRHLQIIVAVRGGMDMAVPPVVPAPVRSTAPSWFVRLVRPAALETRRVFAGPEFPFTEVLVLADPSDEINEVWAETRIVLLSLLIYIVLANAVIYLTLGRDLAPIDSILQGLDRVEKGDYGLRLPRFRIAELSRISEKFNHMVGVMQRSREENRFLTRKSLLIQEQERRRLARELHDELGQSLNAIKAIAVTIAGDAGGQAGQIDTIARIAEQTYDTARLMMQRLRPPVLDELGLTQALQALVDSWNASHPDTCCRLECPARIETLEGDAPINLYRIVQEALANIDRHAQAGSVAVRLTRRPGQAAGEWLILEVQDDGRGFDTSIRRTGLGLLGMRERADAINGEFSLESSTGRGTRIRVELPAGPAAKTMPGTRA